MPGLGRFLAFDVLASRPRHDADDRRDGHPSGVRTSRRAFADDPAEVAEVVDAAGPQDLVP